MIDDLKQALFRYWTPKDSFGCYAPKIVDQVQEHGTLVLINCMERVRFGVLTIRGKSRYGVLNLARWSL